MLCRRDLTFEVEVVWLSAGNPAPLDPRPPPSAGKRTSTPECEACTVCASGYGRGAANECHRCTTGFKAGMYFLITMVVVCTLVMLALLVVYLVRKARVAIRVLAAHISEDSRDPRVAVAVVHFHERPFHFPRAYRLLDQ